MVDKKDLNLTSQHESGVLWPVEAVKIAQKWALEALGVPESTYFYMVWFSFTLGNWKALVSSTEPDGRYYEITHNVDKRETYVDTYVKTHNKCYREPADAMEQFDKRAAREKKVEENE